MRWREADALWVKQGRKGIGWKTGQRRIVPLFSRDDAFLGAASLNIANDRM